MLSIVILSSVTLSVTISVIMLIAIMLSVILLSAIDISYNAECHQVWCIIQCCGTLYAAFSTVVQVEIVGNVTGK
jgi:hypothetical protein